MLGPHLGIMSHHHRRNNNHLIVVPFLLLLASTATFASSEDLSLSRGPLEAESQALRELTTQLTQLRAELSALVRAKEAESAVTDDVGELRAESVALQAEVRKLKADMERLRERRERDLSALGQLKTGQVAQRWLRKSVEELRTELGELAKVQNVSAALRQRQQCEAALTLLRSDVASLRADQEELRAGREKHGALLRQLQQDVADIRARDVHQAQTDQILRDQMSQLKQEMTVPGDPVSRQRNMKSANEFDNRITSGGDELWNYITGKKHHHLRHHGGVRAELYAVIAKQARLEEQLQQMRHNQSALTAVTEQTRLQMSLLLNDTNREAGQLPSVQRSIEELRRRLVTMEDGSVSVHEAMRNASVAVSGMEKLHTSTVQLFEALEALETECDRGVGTLRREMSKVEFNVAQMASSVNVIKEDQTAQGSSLQTARRAVAQMQGRVDTQNYRLTALETEGINATVRRCKESNEQLLLRVQLQDLREGVGQLQQERAVRGPTTGSQDSEDGPMSDRVRNLSAQLPAIAAHLAALDDANLKIVRHLPSDCGEVQPSSVASDDNVFLIHPRGMSKALEVRCEFSGSEAWTVFQRRTDKKEDFHRTWNEYKTGFGNARSSYWLGNDALHSLTADGDHELRVELWTSEGHYRYAEYHHFAVSGEDSGYKLHVSGHEGNASDALRAHDGMLFSTKDRDLDHSGSTNCALFYLGGWWYNRCQQANANGHFDVGFTWYDAERHVWLQLARIQMAVRRRATN